MNESAPSKAASADAGMGDVEAFAQSEIIEGRFVRKVEPRRAILTLVALFALGWLYNGYVDELRYHFSSPELTELGAAEELPETVLPIDAYVQVEGVLSNKAASISAVLRPASLRSGPVQIRQLVGTPIYVEFDQDRFLDEMKTFTPVKVRGRLADFGPGSELDRVRGYFTRTYAAEPVADARLLILEEVPGEMWRYPIALLIFLLIGFFSVYFFIKSTRVFIPAE